VPVLESVPNVSEGRELAVVERIGAAFATAGVSRLDTHVDRDHHRSVFTLIGPVSALVDALVAGIGQAAREIDLERHAGVHPRVGAADVVPIVPLRTDDLPTAHSAALAVARRVGDELELPVFLYGALAGGVRPPFYRRGGVVELARRVSTGELVPAHGPATVGLHAGAVLVGVRQPLVAYNLVVGGGVAAAREIAAAVRESSGGLPGVQALGLGLPDGRAQVSTNVVDLDATPPHVLTERIASEAARRCVEVGAGELVGLLFASVVERAARAAGDAHPLADDGLPTEGALELTAAALRLEQLESNRVLEWHLARLGQP